MSGLPLLSVLIWWPIVGGVVVLVLGSGGLARAGKFVALVFSVLTFALSVLLYIDFDLTTSEMQFVEQVPWITQFNAYYYLGLDGISLPLILLTTFLTPLVVLAGWEVIKLRPAQYFASFLILEGLMIGVFAALDALL
ncbi:MAG: NADH-quinone oxidoreductase subunit M, partial [Gammaproteobacteria bacterium]